MKAAPKPKSLQPDQEAQQLLDLYKGELPKALASLETQYATLQSRAQLLLGLVTITLTITGFSGPGIAASSFLARWAVTAGLGCSLLAALLVVGGILAVRWVTALDASNGVFLLEYLIRRRERKTRYYRAALVVLSLGLALFTLAATVFLSRVSH